MFNLEPHATDWHGQSIATRLENIRPLPSRLHPFLDILFRRFAVRSMVFPYPDDVLAVWLMLACRFEAADVS